MKQNNKIFGVFVLIFLIPSVFILIVAGVDQMFSFLKILAITMGLACIVGFLSVFIHELGHLVMGLLTGYKFVSFRIYKFHFQKEANGKIKFYYQGIPGTEGQCLMMPSSEGKLPIFWYNFGGVFFNMIAVLIGAFVFMSVPTPKYVKTMSLLVILFNGIFVFANWLPLKKVHNDGNNYRLTKNSDLAREALRHVLIINAKANLGARNRDLNIDVLRSLNLDYEDHLQVGLSAYIINDHMHKGEYEEALKLHMTVYEKVKDSDMLESNILQLDHYVFRLMFECEDAFDYNTEKVKVLRKAMQSNVEIINVDVLEDYYKNDKVLNETLYEKFNDACQKSSTQGLALDTKESLDDIVIHNKTYRVEDSSFCLKE